MKASEILERAADLIEPENAWTQGTYARNAKGHGGYLDYDEAVCWCAAGALRHVAPDDDERYPANAVLCTVIGTVFDLDDGGIASWNDEEGRTQSEVVSALRRAASLAKEREGT